MFIDIFTRKSMRILFCIVFLVYILKINAIVPENDEDEIVDLGIRLSGDNRDSLIADLIAEEKDVLNAGLIDGVDLYHFRIRRKRSRRSKRAIEQTIEDLKLDERIDFVTVGESLYREKRGFIDKDSMIDVNRKYQQMSHFRSLFGDDDDDDDKAKDKTDTPEFKISFNDELYHKQWYLENEGQFQSPVHHDINVVPAWLAGYNGKGITICIIDDGLDHAHPELKNRYRPECSYDLNDLNDTEHDPSPGTNDAQNSHGTRCGGAAAGEANNELCGVGVAHGAFIAGIRLLDGRITTLLEARSLTLFAADTHIKSASWGPSDDGTRMEAPGAMINGVLDYVVTQGRQGKGTIFVWASGNGGASGDDCGADGYASHPSVISVGSITFLGETTYFGESCPSTMAVAYTGGAHGSRGKERLFPYGVVSSDVNGKCTSSFFGTSAAAPIAAGAFGLVLEANPDLGYRDMMHIIAQTARIPNLSEVDDWIINGAGYHVSHKFGFGVLDVAKMVAAAQKWTNVQPKYECYFEYTGGSQPLHFGGVVEIPIDVNQCGNITKLEHVVANISYSYYRRGSVKIILVSPSRTPSEMLSYRYRDNTDQSVRYFPFMSAHNWGENPLGQWILRVEALQPQSDDAAAAAQRYGDRGELSHFGLRLYGSHTATDESEKKRSDESPRFAYTPTRQEIESIYHHELEARDTSNIIQKRDYEKLRQEKQVQKRENDLPEDRSLFGVFRDAYKL